MCDPVKTGIPLGCANVKQTPPEQRLADAIYADLGVAINPQALRLFVRWKWGLVKEAAHAIHDGK